MALTGDPADCQRCREARDGGGNMCFGHKARTLVFGGSRTSMVREFRHPDKGYRIKQTKDDATERGNVVTSHAVGDRQDVLVRPDPIQYAFGRKT